jgi:hypothetical protein
MEEKMKGKKLKKYVDERQLNLFRESPTYEGDKLVPNIMIIQEQEYAQVGGLVSANGGTLRMEMPRDVITLKDLEDMYTPTSWKWVMVERDYYQRQVRNMPYNINCGVRVEWPRMEPRFVESPYPPIAEWERISETEESPSPSNEETQEVRTNEG